MEILNSRIVEHRPHSDGTVFFFIAKTIVKVRKNHHKQIVQNAITFFDSPQKFI